MRKLMALGFLTAMLAALAFAGSSTAAPPVVNVITVAKDVADVQVDVNPCTGDPAVNSSIGRFTSKITIFADGTIQVMLTTHGDLSIDSVDPAEADFTGHWTDAFTFTGTNGAAAETSVFTPVLKGTDGSHVMAHYMAHTTVDANGDVTVDLSLAHSNTDCVSP